MKPSESANICAKVRENWYKVGEFEDYQCQLAQRRYELKARGISPIHLSGARDFKSRASAQFRHAGMGKNNAQLSVTELGAGMTKSDAIRQQACDAARRRQ